MSGLYSLFALVKLIYIFNLFTCGEHKNLFLLLAICLYAAGEVWYILKNLQMIKGCQSIYLLSFLLACSKCCCQSPCGVLSSNSVGHSFSTFLNNS